MHRFNFEIDPSARITCRPKERQPTRDLLKSIVAKSRNRAIAPNAESKPGFRAGATPSIPRNPLQTGRHEPFAQFSRPATAARGSQCEYRDFRICTSQRNPLVWVAHFSRADGRCVLWNGSPVLIVETAPYAAESLAIADAKLSIDDLMRSES